MLRCALGTISGGGQALVQVTAIVATDASGTITNRATVFADQALNAPGDATASSAVTITPHPPTPGDTAASHLPPPLPTPPPLHPARPRHVEPSANLVVTNHFSHARVRRGRRITNTITVTNRGPDAASDVRLTHAFSLPFNVLSVQVGQGDCTTSGPITCTLGNLPVHKRVTLRIVSGAAVAGDQHVVAGAASASRDPDPRSAVAHTTARVIPFLNRRLHSFRRTLPAGHTTLLRTHVTNVNGITLHDVRTCLTLPAGLAYHASRPRSTAAPHRRAAGLGAAWPTTTAPPTT